MTKKNGLQTFKNELFEVAVTLEDGQVLFDVEKVAISLGITQNKKDKLYVRWERVNDYLPDNSPLVGKGDFIAEPLVYKLAFKASNEVAEQFQDWLSMEVIPVIRKTGGYVEEGSELEFVSKYFPSFSEEVKLAMVNDLIKSNKELKEKASYWDKFLDTNGTYTFTDVAKMISTRASEECEKQIKISNQALTKYLREHGILSKNKSGSQFTNVPNQEYEDYFNVTAVTVSDKISKPQTKVKSNGVEFIYDMLILDEFDTKIAN